MIVFKILFFTVLIGLLMLIWLINANPFVREVNVFNPKQLLRNAMSTPALYNARLSWKERVLNVPGSGIYVFRQPHEWGFHAIQRPNTTMREWIAFPRNDVTAIQEYSESGKYPQIKTYAILKETEEEFPEVYDFTTIRGTSDTLLAGLRNTWIFTEPTDREGYIRTGILTDGNNPGRKLLFWCESEEDDPFATSTCETLVRTLTTGNPVNEKEVQDFLK